MQGLICELENRGLVKKRVCGVHQLCLSRDYEKGSWNGWQQHRNRVAGAIIRLDKIAANKL